MITWLTFLPGVLRARVAQCPFLHVSPRISAAIGYVTGGPRRLTLSFSHTSPNQRQTAISCFPVAYHDYEGPAVDTAERERLVKDLGTANYLVLRNHGPVVCDKTAAGAFRSIHQFEAACQAQVDAMPGGGVLGEMPLVVPEDIVAHAVERRRVALAKRPTVELHWPAMPRLLDRRDPGWRD